MPAPHHCACHTCTCALQQHGAYTSACTLRSVAHLGPVKSVAQTEAGMLDAPCGTAAICFMYALGVTALAAWDQAVAADSLAVYHEAVTTLLHKHGGYRVDAGPDGLSLAAFLDGAAAVRWALDTVDACLHADWPQELLDHPLGEQVAVQAIAVGGGDEDDGEYLTSCRHLQQKAADEARSWISCTSAHGHGS
jgi:hypothetical protein